MRASMRQGRIVLAASLLLGLVLLSPLPVASQGLGSAEPLGSSSAAPSAPRSPLSLAQRVTSQSSEWPRWVFRPTSQPPCSLGSFFGSSDGAVPGATIEERTLRPLLSRSADTVCQEAEPLPAFDDFGNPISLEEIEALMRSGGGVGVLGGVLGVVLGGAIGAGIAFGQCGILENCSPRQDALAIVAFFSGVVWGGALGGILASNVREIDRWEALEKVRAERRSVAGRAR